MMNMKKKLEKYGDTELAKKLLNGAHVCEACGHVGFEDDSNPVKEFFHFTVLNFEYPFEKDGYYFFLCEECNKKGNDR